MNDSIIHVTDSSFEEECIKIGGAGNGRLLGRVVWSLQDDSANPG